MIIGRSVLYAIGVHGALTTGIHGVGAKYLAISSGSDQLITNADVAAAAAIIRDKLNFGDGLVDDDIAAAAEIAIAKLVDAVCSETEADGKITDHTGVAEAHQVVRTIVTGSYTGNQTARQIAVGFKCSLVITHTILGQTCILIPSMTLRHSATSVTDVTTSIYLHASDGFYLTTSQDANYTDRVYYYWAISE